MIGGRASSFFIVALAALSVVSPATAEPQEPVGTLESLSVEPHAGATPLGDIEARAWVSQTALWAGDRITYTVEVTCAPSFDILVEDLAADRLVLTGLELVSAEHERRVSNAGGLTYLFRYRLTTYDVVAPTLRIGGPRVRYYVRRAGQSVADLAPAGELQVAGAVLALRSTIPDEFAAVAVRDARPAAALPAATRARPVGLGLMLLSAAPLVLWMGGLLRRARPRAARRRGRESRNVTRLALEELRAASVSSDAERRAAYGRLEALLRQHLAEFADIPAPALTAAEISERLRANGSSLPAESVAAVLEDCERARYGPTGLLPSAERFQAHLGTVEELVTASR